MSDHLADTFARSRAELLAWVPSLMSSDSPAEMPPIPIRLRPDLPLQEQIDATPEGSTVVIPPGTYEGGLTISGKRRVIGSGSLFIGGSLTLVTP